MDVFEFSSLDGARRNPGFSVYKIFPAAKKSNDERPRG